MVAENLSIKTGLLGLRKADVDKYITGMVQEYSTVLSEMRKELASLGTEKKHLLAELQRAKAEGRQVVYEEEPAEKNAFAELLNYSDKAVRRLDRTIALINQIAEQKIDDMVQKAGVQMAEYDAKLARLGDEIEQTRGSVESLLGEVVDLLKTNIDEIIGEPRARSSADTAKTPASPSKTIRKATGNAETTPPAETENVVSLFGAAAGAKPSLTLVSKEVETAVIKTLETYQSLKGEYTKKLESILAGPGDEISGAALFFQINEFVMTNYFLNCSADGALIKAISDYIMSLDKGVYVERLSYDQLGVIYDGQSSKGKVCAFASDVLAYIQSGIFVNGRKAELSANAGIAMYSKNSASAELVINYAGIALYKAKERGKGLYQFVDDNLISEVEFDNALKADLRSAIDNNELVLFYQPQYTAKTKELAGFEALLRWQNPKYYQMSIDDIIKIAEQENLIEKIGLYLFRKACLFAKEVGARSQKRCIISVNFSSIQIANDNFVNIIKRVLGETGVPPEYLGLEITESCFMDCIGETCQKLNQIRNMGITISIDDFGTGYSTLSYLLKLPVSVIKIDKTFLDELESGKKAEIFVASIINTAHNLGLRVVAEGVENERQMQVLAEAGCDYLQGYYLSKPVPENEAYLYL